MAGTVLELHQEPIPIRSHCQKVQELTNVIVRHSPRFQRIAFRHLGNLADAEDAVQDAVLSALAHLDQFKGRAKMSTWLTAIVINSARIRLRRRSAQLRITFERAGEERRLSLADLVSDTRPGPEEIYRSGEIAEILAHATIHLSPILRRTFHLRDVRGLSIRETARVLGVPCGTVKARLARARASLRQAIIKGTRKSVRQYLKVG
jgi:RNA polymerase sigma-70 factor, ECF subfamily